MLQADRSTLLIENVRPCLLTYSKHFLIINMSGNFIINSTPFILLELAKAHTTHDIESIQQTREVFREDIPRCAISMQVN